MLADNIQTEVEDEVLYALAQRCPTATHLETLAQLMSVDTQSGGQLTDSRIGMLQEVVGSLEAWLCRVFDSLLQNGIIQGRAERQSIARQVEVHILCHAQVHGTAIVSLQVLEDHLLTMADDVLYEETLHLGSLFLLSVQTKVGY